MYEAFYGLREKPFNLTPDPRFLYLSTKHKEAFAHLLYGIKNLCGFVLLSGEIGTGKTTICRTLLNQLDEDVEVAFTFNPSLSAEEMLRSINQDFGIESKAETVKGLIDELNAHLLERTAAGKNCVLVMDEAQTLSPEVLEQIRLLSNLETETRKLLQIVLIGQPELIEKLSLDQLRQLDQRITARYHLEPLDAQETLQYIAYRLRVAGGRNKVQFTKAAVKAVYRESGGIPRVINALCDRALLIGYTREIRDIDRDLVEQAASEIRGPAPARQKAPSFLRQFMPNPTVIVSVILLLAGMKYLVDRSAANYREAIDSLSNLARQQAANARPSPPATSGPVEAAALPQQTPAPKTEEQPVPVEPAPAEAPQPLPEVSPEPAASADTAVAGEAPPAPVQDRPEEALSSATKAVLAAWGVTAPAALPEGETAQDILACATANGLSAEVLSSTLAQLEAINLPALVLVIGNQRKVWSGLVGVEGDLLRVTTPAGDTALVSKSEFSGLYLGEAIIPWRDPTPGAGVLSLNMRGDAVRVLQVQLVALGLSQASLDGVFGPDTDKAVRALQSSAGLGADGRVGQQTRMVMTSWLPGFETPALQERQFTVPEQLVQLRERLKDKAPADAPTTGERAAAPPETPPVEPASEAPKAESEAPEPEQAPAAPAEAPVEQPAAPAPETEAPKAEETPAALTDAPEKGAESPATGESTAPDAAASENKVVPAPEAPEAAAETPPATQPEAPGQESQGGVIVLEELPPIESEGGAASESPAAEGEKAASEPAAEPASPEARKEKDNTSQKSGEAASVTAPAAPTFPLVPHGSTQDGDAAGGPDR